MAALDNSRESVFVWHDESLFGRRFRDWQREHLRQTWSHLTCLWSEKSVDFWQCFNNSFEAYYTYYIFARQQRRRTADLCRHTKEAFTKLVSANCTGKQFSEFMTHLLSLSIPCDDKRDEVLYFSEINFGKGSSDSDPFFRKDTRAGYRHFFGQPVDAHAYAKAADSLEVYIHYAYSVAEVLLRWMNKQMDVAPQGPGKLKKPPTFSIVVGRGPATSRELTQSAKFFVDLFDQEIGQGSPDGPRFICCWRLGDPRFVDARNPLYDRSAARGSDWRVRLTLPRYLELCEYVLDILIPWYAKIGLSGPVCCSLMKVTPIPPEMLPMIDMRSFDLGVSTFLDTSEALSLFGLATPGTAAGSVPYGAVVADRFPSTSNASTTTVHLSVASSSNDKTTLLALSAIADTAAAAAAAAAASSATTAVTRLSSGANIIDASAAVAESAASVSAAPNGFGSPVEIPEPQNLCGHASNPMHSPCLSKQPASLTSMMRPGPAMPSQSTAPHGADGYTTYTQALGTRGPNGGILQVAEQDLLGILCPACKRPLEKGRCMTCEPSDVPNTAGLSKEVINKLSQAKNKDKKRVQLQQKLQKKNLYNEFTNQPQIKQLLIELCVGLEAEGIIDDVAKKRQALVERLQNALTDKLLRGFSPDCIATIHAMRMELMHQSETWVHWFIRECPEESGQFFNSELVKHKATNRAPVHPPDEQKVAGSMQQLLVSGRVAGAASKEASNKSSAKVRPLRYCATESCRVQEAAPRTFKKCLKCVDQKAKEPRYYCSQGCQVEDWALRHRAEHTIQPVQLDIVATPGLLLQGMPPGLQLLPPSAGQT